ncbi:MAG: tRNA (cytidine(34)-2'-O)-methyltransferase [Lachnospirales bacterium]
MNIVLLEPEQGGNTGNIGRTCIATNSTLHLIRPLGFKLTSKELKKAGMDYWPSVNYKLYDDFKDFLEKNNYPVIYMATTKSKKTYADINYKSNDFIMFGKESGGIPEEILVDYRKTCIRIPMDVNARSLNLSNSVAIVVYEAMRQNFFQGLEIEGELHNLNW